MRAIDEGALPVTVYALGLVIPCLGPPQEHLAILRPDLEAEESYVYRLPPVRGAGTSEAVLAAIRSRCGVCSRMAMDLCCEHQAMSSRCDLSLSHTLSNAPLLREGSDAKQA